MIDRPAELSIILSQAVDLVPAALHGSLGVFTDIDDTLTADGRIDPPAATALAELRAAGVPVIAITGRPLGWCLPLLGAWPLDAMVAENGGAALIPDGDGARVEFAQPAAERVHNAERLRAAAARVLHEVPGATLARDSDGRVTDIAVDHSEFARLDEAQIETVVRLMRDEGLTATVSSIHVNGWIGTHTKLSAAHWMLRRLYGRELAGEIDRWVYVGDSTNDQLMFGAFERSVGVANLRRFAAQLHTWPRWITRGERGAGFAEVAQAVIAGFGR
ncbi:MULTISPECIES: HAD-IIB family hydrolase [unclassified Rubrivivax]|uniref:HAD-IIB family hydrolase n=1 Tax=unclassified Rubrivivax TaxID=2649762 RepID=UPI001E3AE4D5|nr:MULTISPECIES: HAD-IIB family hydrolase [unclassified Rubrivivax]MCC9596414.1 HAD-IIB family hydrolase [Rubrivivax sp. JA1055]MCC9647242.1 HAD-IIB family hydrolase [Rubrivivax sp. JA1029]